MSRRMLQVGWIGPLVTAMALVGCGGGERPPAAAAGGTSSSPPAVSAAGPAGMPLGPSFDVGSIMRQVSRAFRPEGTGLRSVQPTFVAGVDTRGGLEVRARHYPAHGERLESAPFTLRTRSIDRGAPLAGAPTVRVDGKGGVAIDRGPVLERVETRDGAAEHSWAFDRRPDGTGDLVVRVVAQGLPYKERTSGGLHFADPTSGVGVRYGDATFVDASGRRQPVALAWQPGQSGEAGEPGEIVLRVPGEVLDAASYPAVLDPTVSAEFGSDNPVSSPTVGGADDVAIAFGGGQYLVVWSDARNDEANEVWGTRVSTAGAVLDPVGISIASYPISASAPAVGYAGTNFVVAVRDANVAPARVIGYRIAANGTVVGGAYFNVSDGAAKPTAMRPAMACDGIKCVVAWTDVRDGGLPDIYAAVVENGAVNAPGTFVVMNTAQDKADPCATFDGANFLVAWADNRAGNWDIYGRQVSPSGFALGSGSGIVISANAAQQTSPAAASNGVGTSLIAWADTRDGSSNIYGGRVNAGGTAVDIGTNGFAISTATGDQKLPAVGFGGGYFLVAYFDQRAASPAVNGQIYGTRVAVNATLVDAVATGRAITSSSVKASPPAVGFDGTRYLAAWTDYRNASNDGSIYAARIRPGDFGLEEPNAFILSTSENGQTLPHVAFDGTNYLLAWNDARGGVVSVWGTRVGPNGAILDPTGISISGAGGAAEGVGVAFDSHSARYLVVWAEGTWATYDVRGRLYDTSGAPMGAAFTISGAAGQQRIPDVAAGPGGFLVVWLHESSDLYASRVSSGGVVGDPAGILVDTGVMGNINDPAVASNGVTYLVVWSRGNDIVADRIDGSGARLGATTISAGANPASSPAVGYGSGNYLVGFARQTGAPNGLDLYARRVDATTGAPTDVSDISVATGTAVQGMPGISWDGTTYVIGWVENQPAGASIRAGRVNALGPAGTALVDGVGGFLVSPVAAEALSGPELASDNMGRTVLTYHHFLRGAPYGTFRTVGRFIGDRRTNGIACTDPAQCASDACASGVCCNVACTGPHATFSCSEVGSVGTCVLVGCVAGWGNCDGAAANGCEVDLTTTATHCGSCANSCSSNHIATPACTAGVCSGACDSGWADCDGDKLANGCEVDIVTDASHCGGCANVCPGSNIAAATCTAGVCSGICDAGYADCNGNMLADGCEVDTQTDTGNCGGCGTVCSASHIAVACTAGVCNGVCAAGYADCDSNKQSDGCETDIDSDTNNCGGCGAAFGSSNSTYICSSNHIRTTTCVAGVCNGSCDPGFHDCVGDKSVSGNGCETDTRVIGNCGGCGVTCDDGSACTTDVCNVVAGDGACGHVSTLACAAACSPAVGCGYNDADDDGLNDTWETDGYIDVNCNGVNDVGVDTPLPGADVNKPNVYVKYDYMTGGGHSHQPSATAMNRVKAAFAAHDAILGLYPTSDALAEHAVVSLSPPGAVPACAGPDAVSLYTLKAAHFPSYLAPAYHYVVFGHFNTCDSAVNCALCPATGKSGAAPTFGTVGLAEAPGDDFIVSLGQLVDLGLDPSDLINAGSFMHELGHNLGLRHGGNDDLNRKPNYISVMNYSYQFGIGVSAAPGPWSTTAVDPSVDYRLDYSSFVAGTLSEGTLAGGVCTSDGSGGLTESAGVTGAAAGNTDVVVFYAADGKTAVYGPSNGSPIDWNNTPPASDANVYADISGDGACNALSGYSDWAQTRSGGATRLTNLSTRSECNTGNWADGAPNAGTVEDREPTGQRMLDDHKALPFKHVRIDVRPGCGANWIVLAGSGTVPVAVYGAADFDVRKIDQASLRFAGAPAVSASVGDVDGDGNADLTARFLMSALHLVPASTTADLVGAQFSSQAFGGSDAITLVPDPGPVVTLVDDGTGYARTLWPPGGQPVDLTLADCIGTATDRCGATLSIAKADRIVRITADESPIGGRGGDMQITGSDSFRLMPVRAGRGDGRVYTITFEAADSDGNASTWQCRIQVPHDPRAPAVDSGRSQCVGDGC